MLIVLSILIAGGGVALVGVGLRGRLVNPRPHCRRCNYELTGLRHTRRCPECGARIGSRANRVRGLRRRRSGPILVGLALLLISVVPLTIHLVNNVWKIDGNALKPTWYVMQELDVPQTRDAALDELAKRSRAGKLSATHAASIALRFTRALSRRPQADGLSLREYALARQLLVNRLLDSPTAAALVQELLVVETRAPFQFGQNDPLEYAIDINWRVPDHVNVSRWSERLTAVMRDIRIEIDDKQVWCEPPTEYSDWIAGRSEAVLRVGPALNLPPTMLGLQRFVVRGMLELYENPDDLSIGATPPQPLARVDFRTERSTTIITQPRLRQMDRYLKRHDGWFGSSIAIRRYGIREAIAADEHPRVFVDVGFENEPPCPASFAVILLLDGVPFPAGTTEWLPQDESQQRHFSVAIPDRTPPRALAVQLVPGGTLWRRDIDDKKGWNGTIRFPTFLLHGPQWDRENVFGFIQTDGIFGDLTPRAPTLTAPENFNSPGF